jgi:hypothetical protein
MAPIRSKGRLSPAVKRRSGLVPISEEMKAWSAALEMEVAEWPRISRKPMFGMTALYRGPRIFAVLPRTQGMGSPNALAFKLEKPGPRLLTQIEREQRIQTTVMRARRWYVFELSSDRDLRDALDWLRKAYEAAS